MKDTRDPVQLYGRIKTVQKNNGYTILQAADAVEEMRENPLIAPMVHNMDFYARSDNGESNA